MLMPRSVCNALLCALIFAAHAASAWAQPSSGEQAQRRDLNAIRGVNPPESCFSGWSTAINWLKTSVDKHSFHPSWPVPPQVPSAEPGQRWAALDQGGRWHDLDTTDLSRLEEQVGAQRLACVLDRVTSLVWAVNLEGRQPKKWHPGAPIAGGNHLGELVEHAQKSNWCGRNDWQVPSRTQALSLADYHHGFSATAVTELSVLGFPKSETVWTATTVAGGPVTSYMVGQNPVTHQTIGVGMTQEMHTWLINIPLGYTHSESQKYEPTSNTLKDALLVSPATCVAFGRVYWR